jgi:hypothetical protein
MADEMIYVDSRKGNDKNNGITANTAFKTLKKAFAAVTEKRNVIILEGIFDVRTEKSFKSASVFNVCCELITEITIKGNKNSSATLKGDNSHRVLYISGNTAKIRFENINITGGKAQTGAGIYIMGADVTLGKGVKVNSNRANRFGGAVFIDSGTLNITEDCTIENNIAGREGSAIYIRTMQHGSVCKKRKSIIGGNIDLDFSRNDSFKNDTLVVTRCGRKTCCRVNNFCLDCRHTLLTMNAGTIICDNNKITPIFIDNSCFLKTGGEIRFKETATKEPV